MSSNVVLTRGEETFQLPRVQWAMMLELAMQFGWMPMGTEEPRNDDPRQASSGEWQPSNYTSADGQLIGDEDAKRLAFALWTAKAKGAMPFEGLAEFCIKGAVAIY